MTETTGRGASTSSERVLTDHLPPPRRLSLAAVGLFVILGLGAFLVILFTMTEPAALRSRHEVYAVVQDAGGVRRGDPVQMRGVNIGRVKSFEMMEEEGLVRMSLELENRWRVPHGSIVEVGDPGLFGGRTVMILPGSGPGLHEGGDVLPSIGEGGGSMFESIEALSENASVFLDRVGESLDSTTLEAFRSSVLELETLLTTTRMVIGTQGAAVGAMAASVKAAADSVARVGAVGPELLEVAAEADSVLETVGSTLEGIDSVLVLLRSVLASIDEGKGTLGLLVNDRELYDNVNAMTLAAADLLADFKENPKKYIDVSIF